MNFCSFIRHSGLSMSQVTVLTHIYFHGSCEIAPLVEMLEVSKAGTGQLLERMEQQGLIERSVAPNDHRARRVSLTPSGCQIVEESITARQAWMNDLLAEVPVEQHAAITQSLQILTLAASKLENTPGKFKTGQKATPVKS